MMLVPPDANSMKNLNLHDYLSSLLELLEDVDFFSPLAAVMCVCMIGGQRV